MRFVVTGGAGFIGSHISRALLTQGHDVLVFDNLDPSYPIELKRYNLKQLKKYPQFTFAQIDIRDTEKLSANFDTFKPEIIFHLAAKAGVRQSFKEPEEYFSVNVLGTLSILEAARRHGVQQVLAASSSSVYGNDSPIPFSESNPTEHQISPYASSKKAMEVMCKTYAEVYKLPIQLFRFFTVYGPSGRPDMAPALFTSAIVDGKPFQVFGGLTSERDYTFITDIVEGLLQAMKHSVPFGIYNLGNNQPISLKTFIKTIEEATGNKANFKIIEKQQGDVEKTWADISLAQNQFEYQPKTSLDKGIKDFVWWFVRHKKLYSA